MAWSRIAQAARQRWHQHGTRAGRFAPGLIAGGLALLALLFLMRLSWRDGHEAVAQAEAPAQHVAATAAISATATAAVTATVTAPITTTATPTPTITQSPTQSITQTATPQPGSAAQSPLPTPDILGLLSASLGESITVSIPLPGEEIEPPIEPQILPDPTLTPTQTVTPTLTITEVLATEVLATEVLTQPVAGRDGMGALIAAARARAASGHLPRLETPTAPPADESAGEPEGETAPDQDAAPSPEPEATPIPELPPPAPTAAIAPTPDGTVRTARVPILMYHYLSVPPADANIYRLDLSVTPDLFAAHLDAIQQAGYTTISLYTWLAHLTQGAPLPDKPVVLTFDDGYRDAYENAFPLLRSRGMTATFFVVTDFIDEQRPEYLTWDMVREMYAGGMSIESHGRNHVSLKNKDADYLIWQALGSLETIEYELGVRPRFISYPAGDYDQTTIDIFHSANYWAGFTTQQGATHSSDDLFRVKRVRVHGDTSPEQLLRLLALDW